MRYGDEFLLKDMRVILSELKLDYFRIGKKKIRDKLGTKKAGKKTRNLV